MRMVHPDTHQYGFTLDEDTNFEWGGVDKPVRHFVLSVRPYSGLPGKAVCFTSCEQTADPVPMADTVYDAGNIVRAIVGNNNSTYPHTADVKNYNINIIRRTWVVVELDPEVNWRFHRSFPAITTKEEYTFGSNICLRYVYKEGNQVLVSDSPRPDKICRFVFFGVVHRTKDEKHYFNIAVEFYHGLSGGEPTELIPLIIDPTVPEDGHEEFPPP